MTSIFFSRNTHPDIKASVLSVVGIDSDQWYEKYLGLPAVIGHSKVQAFAGVKGKVWDIINEWKEKFLSQAGKEILLKAVIQAIPIYTMSVFQLPKTMCKDLNSMMSKFWWGLKENNSKAAWMSWERMRKSKESGGLGFRDLESFNMALLAKQGWRIVQYPDSLVARIYKEKYFSRSTFLETPLGKTPSYAWRSIWNSKKLLQDGLVWLVGDGRTAEIWGEKWLDSPVTYSIQTPARGLDHEATMSALIDEDTNWWNGSLVEEIFMANEVERICGMVISPNKQADQLVWMGNKNGDFSVKSAYHLARDRLDNGRWEQLYAT